MSSSYRTRFGVKPLTNTMANTRAVTAKQLIEVAKKPKDGGGFVLTNSQLYTVKVCGMVTSIDQEENHTDYEIFDGTGVLKGRIWAQGWSGETQLTGAMLNSYYEVVANMVTNGSEILLQTLKATKIRDHNIVTMHLLTAIHEHCELSQIKPKDLDRWEREEQEATRSIRKNMSLQLDKEAIECLLSTEAVRASEWGATTACIRQHLHLDEETTRSTLEKMLNEGSIYNTIDCDHFKMADDN